MVAIVSLSAEEADLTVYGALPEPSFRPFPGSVREREADEELEREFAALDGDIDADELGEAPQSDAPFAYPAERVLARVGAAQRWKRSAREPAILGVRRDDAFWIVALGTVEGGTRTTFRGARNLGIRVRYLLRESIRLDDFVEELSSRQKALLRGAMDGPLRPLSPKLATAVMGALFAGIPDFASVFGGIRDQLNAEAIAQARVRLARPAVLAQEAVSSALHFFGANWSRMQPEASPEPSDFALQLEESAGVIENDFIADDSVVFPGWDRSQYSQRGWWEFHDKSRRLLVKNINVSPQENRTGADLVYVRRDPDAFVLVQYKLLSQLTDGRLIFRPDGRLDDQVLRMLDLENGSRGPVSPDDLDTYRLGAGFSFVKFILPATARPERPGELTPGFYFPGEYARRLLLNPDKGPHGGAVYFVTDHRSIPAETFARLVRDTWVGSTGDATALLRQLFGLRDTDADLVLAVDEPMVNAAASSVL